MTAQQRARVEAAIQTALSRLPESLRHRLSGTLSEGEPKIVEDYLVAVCSSTLRGAKQPRKLPEFRFRDATPDREDRRKEAALKSLLPAILKARRASVPGPSLTAFGLYANAGLIRRGDSPAAEYFLRWVVAADEASLKENDHAVQRNMAALAGFMPAKWPEVELRNARLTLIADCLHYLNTASPLPKSMQQRLASGRWNELSDIVLAVCTARQDRAAVPFLAKRLTKERKPLMADAVGDYYSRVGLPADIPLLDGYAQRLCPNSSQDSNDWLGLVRIQIEDAVRIIRLRDMLSTCRTTVNHAASARRE